MNIFKTITGFIGKYADEADATATALNMIVDNLAIQAQDKAQIKGYISALGDAPSRIRDALATMREPTPVKIDAADVNRAVAAAMKDNKAFQDAVDKGVAASLDAKLEDRLPSLVDTSVAAALKSRFGDGTQPLADPTRDLRDADNAADLAEREPTDQTTRGRQTAADGGTASRAGAKAEKSAGQ